MIGKDKWWHLIGCFLITVALGWQCGWVIGLITSQSVGYMKEEYDKEHGGTYDKWDLVANGVGGIVGVAVLLLFGRPPIWV